MAKVVVVLSFDEAEDRAKEIGMEVLDSIRETFKDRSDFFAWIGIKESAEAVLDAIGVD